MARDPPYVAIRPRTKRLGHDVAHHAEVPSTMALARGRAQAGAPEGLVVVADRQTAGQGRRGRTWTTVGSSLHATLLLRPKVPADHLSLLPLAAGVALVEAARKLLRLDLRLKWPNDVLYGGRKLGGVLVDAVYTGSNTPDFVLVGLGVNGDARPSDFPRDLQLSATSLSDAAGRHVCLPALLKLFLEAFEPRYEELRAGEATRVWALAKGYLSTLGKNVRVHTGDGVIQGQAIDLGPDGELLVRSEHGVHAVRSGDCEELRTA